VRFAWDDGGVGWGEREARSANSKFMLHNGWAKLFIFLHLKGKGRTHYTPNFNNRTTSVANGYSINNNLVKLNGL
jgi:hypothetical protein